MKFQTAKPRLIPLLLLALFLMAGATSCNSTKRAAQKRAAQELAEKRVQAIADLTQIINDEPKLTLEEKEYKLAAVKKMNLTDPEVNRLLAIAEEKVARERAIVEREREAERIARERDLMNMKRYEVLNAGFDAVATAFNSYAANQAINDALRHYANENIPVLILISREGETKDYDRPTTIRKYLEFVKDQKKSTNRVLEARYDSNGKIMELELIKK